MSVVVIIPLCRQSVKNSENELKSSISPAVCIRELKIKYQKIGDHVNNINL